MTGDAPPTQVGLRKSAPIRRKVLSVHPWTANLIIPDEETRLFMLSAFNEEAESIYLQKTPLHFSKASHHLGERVEIFVKKAPAKLLNSKPYCANMKYLGQLGFSDPHESLMVNQGQIIGSVALVGSITFSDFDEWEKKFYEERFKHFFPGWAGEKPIKEMVFRELDEIHGWRLARPKRYAEPIDYDFKGSMWNIREIITIGGYW